MSETSGRTVAQRNRSIRQEALREQLAEQCRVQHILDNITKLEDLAVEMDANAINRIKSANEQRIKVMGKYLPDLKSTEITGEAGEALRITTVELVPLSDQSPD